MAGFHMTIKAVPVLAGVGALVAVEVVLPCLRVLIILQRVLTLSPLLWYLQTCLSVLNGHFYEIQKV